MVGDGGAESSHHCITQALHRRCCHCLVCLISSMCHHVSCCFDSRNSQTASFFLVELEDVLAAMMSFQFCSLCTRG
jgi:hypothetical protein